MYDVPVNRLAATLLAVSLGLPAPAFAAGLSPEQAEQRRAEVRAETDSLAKPAAIEKLRREAEALGDPELFLAASELVREQAEADADEDLAGEAATLADTARDIALYLVDERRFTATDWRPVTRERASELATQAERAGEQARELAATIVREREAAAESSSTVEQPDDDRKRERKPGTGLIAGGAAMLTLGAGGLAMIGAGLGMGAGHQREAESLELPAEQARLDQLDRLGAQANLISYIGIAVAGVGLATGIALVVVGAKQRKQAGGGSDSASVHAAPWFGREGAGLSVMGRF